MFCRNGAELGVHTFSKYSRREQKDGTSSILQVVYLLDFGETWLVNGSVNVTAVGSWARAERT
jgi:hypothetical protein